MGVLAGEQLGRTSLRRRSWRRIGPGPGGDDGGRPPTSRVPVWWDQFVASDPGFNRLRMALQIVVTIGAAMAVEWVFVRMTHAMELDGSTLPASQAPMVAVQHHGVTVIAMMIGAVVGMIAAFSGSAFPDRGAQLRGLAAMPVLMIGGLALGISVAPHRDLALAMLVVILALGAYCRRFGPIGFFGGQMVFMGDFFGFFLAGTVVLGDLGWLAAEIGVGIAVALGAQFTLFFPAKRRALARMQRSYDARRRDAVVYTLRLLDERSQPERAFTGLQRRLVRLNETALMIDAQLNDPAAIPAGWSAQTLHQILFDAELSVTNLARFVVAVAGYDGVPDDLHDKVRAILLAVNDLDDGRTEEAARELLADLERRQTAGPGDPAWLLEDLHVVLHRLALAALGYADARHRWSAAAEHARTRRAVETAGLETPVELIGGFLMGSVGVSAAASTEPDTAYAGGAGRRWQFWRHIPMTPNLRVAIQMAVAVTAAIVLGELLSGRRFYWAVIAAFVTFMGASNATEQVRKGINRVLGTVIGVLVGAVLAHLVGMHTYAALAVILVAIFLGIYLMRVSYVFMVVGITVMVSQLYVQLDEFSDSLLVLRLEETALGAAVAGLTVVCVLPLRIGRVARVAAREFLGTLEEVIDRAVDVLAGRADTDALRTALRGTDDAYQSLLTVSRSLRTPLFDRGGRQREQFMVAASAARNYARDLLFDAPSAAASAAGVIEQAEAARDQFQLSVQVLLRWLERGTTEGAPYVRSSSLFDRVETQAGAELGSPLELTVSDLQRLDGALAAMAAALGIPVEGLDVAEVQATP